MLVLYLVSMIVLFRDRVRLRAMARARSIRYRVFASVCSWELEGLLYWLVGNQYNTQNSIHPIIVQGFIS